MENIVHDQSINEKHGIQKLMHDHSNNTQTQSMEIKYIHDHVIFKTRAFQHENQNQSQA